MKERTLSVDQKIINGLIKGSELLDIKVFSSKKGDEKSYYNVILNENTLLRLEQKRSERTIRRLRTWTQAANNLVNSKSRVTIRRILELDSQIKEKIRQSTSKSGSSKDAFSDLYQSLERRWSNIKNLESSLGVDLLKRDGIGYCDYCHSFREAAGLVKPSAASAPPLCQFCNRAIKSTKTYYSLPESTARYFNGYWFEDYVARKLETLGWTTFVGPYVYGRSGVKHEVDIIAIRDGRTVLIECKSGGAGLTDLSMFAAKFSEIRTNSAVFVSILKVNPDLHKLGKAVGGLSVIDDIRTDGQLIKRLKSI